MKRVLLFIVLLIGALSVIAQDGSWSITQNKKKIFSASIENEQKNIVLLKLSDFKLKNTFIISYAEKKSTQSKQWARTIGIYNETDKELLRKDISIVKLSNAQLKKMLDENKIIKIYTWALPKDPKEAARVRIRRVHLCTVMLK